MVINIEIGSAMNTMESIKLIGRKNMSAKVSNIAPIDPNRLISFTSILIGLIEQNIISLSYLHSP